MAQLGSTIPITHEEYQAQIVTLAGYLGWKHLHVRRSIGRGKRWTTACNVVGFPDLLLWRHERGFCAIEVKVGKDKATPEQLAVLNSLRAAGARTMVAYPADLDAVKEMLTS